MNFDLGFLCILQVYVDNFFTNTGIREIVTLDNTCDSYKTNSIPYFLQIFVLKAFTNTLSCPIKKVR